MRNQHRFSPLEMRIGRHHGLIGRLRKLDERRTPIGQPTQRCINRIANKQPHIGSDLLVAVATSMKLQSEVADVFRKLEFDEAMNVLGLCRRGGRVAGSAAKPAAT